MPRTTQTQKVPTEPFGVRVPVPLLHRVEAKRIERGLTHRNDAIIEALRMWVEAPEIQEAA
jgi:metal-responsive CopG/Arc/MetJ family transcriptional regulator